MITTSQILGGQEGLKTSYDYFYAQSSGQIDDHLMLLQNGKKESYTLGEEATDMRSLSFFGRLDYDFSQSYFIDFTLRNDANSRFGKITRMLLLGCRFPLES